MQLNTPVDNCGNIAHPGERPTSMQKVSSSNTSYMQSFTSHDKINIKNKLSLYVMTYISVVRRQGSKTLHWKIVIPKNLKPVNRSTSILL